MDTVLVGQVLAGVPDRRGAVDGGIVEHDHARALAVTGEGVLQEAQQISALPRAGGRPPGQGLLGGGTRDGHHVHAPASGVLVGHAGPVPAAAPGYGWGAG